MLICSFRHGTQDGANIRIRSVDVHPDKQQYLKHDMEAKHWQDLDEHQQAAWKERLIKAGEWVEGEGEKVLIGVLFSEYAGLVGQVAREALAGGS